MKAIDIIEGIRIVEQFRPESESPYHIRAEHDRIYIGSLDWPIPEQQKQILEELGWDEDEDADGYTTLL